jgi:hypothetical protein
MNTKGTWFVRTLESDEDYLWHPSGNGIIVVKKDGSLPPRWCRVEGLDVVETVIDLVGPQPSWEVAKMFEKPPGWRKPALWRRVVRRITDWVTGDGP